MIRNFAIATGLSALVVAVATAATIVVPEKSAPESITIAPNGDLILGSMGSAKIYRAKKGSDKPEVFVDASAEGAVVFLGVLADAPTSTLWACQIYSSSPSSTRHSTLRGSDLKTGGGKFRWELPGNTNLCNDFVVGPDKALYISDTVGAKIWRLKPGATVPELFSDDQTLLGIDGITFIGDTLYENNVIFNKLYRVQMDASGKAGKPVDIRLDGPIKGPDFSIWLRAVSNKCSGFPSRRPKSPCFMKTGPGASGSGPPTDWHGGTRPAVGALSRRSTALLRMTSGPSSMLRKMPMSLRWFPMMTLPVTAR